MIKKIPAALAARMMGKKPTFIYIGLQRQILPFGHAVKMGDGSTLDVPDIIFDCVFSGGDGTHLAADF